LPRKDRDRVGGLLGLAPAFVALCWFLSCGETEDVSRAVVVPVRGGFPIAKRSDIEAANSPKPCRARWGDLWGRSP
jgi:hypothetical protein